MKAGDMHVHTYSIVLLIVRFSVILVLSCVRQLHMT